MNKWDLEFLMSYATNVKKYITMIDAMPSISDLIKELEESMKPKFEILNHGKSHSDYFQGCGTFGTPYQHCVTGIGDNAKEAYIDAENQVYDILGDDADDLRLPSFPKGIRQKDKVKKSDGEDVYWRVSIRF